MLALSESLVPNWFRSMSEKVQEWSDKFFKWQELKKHALSFLMKEMLSEEQDSMMEVEVIMKCRELCSKLSIKWMDLKAEEISKY